MYTIYTTDNCSRCDMLKKMIAIKHWQNLNIIHNPDEETLTMLRDMTIREFPAILDLEKNKYSVQQFMIKMDMDEKSTV